MQRYSELRVWREAHGLLLAIYEATAQLPSEERYGLSSQVRRAALSVPTNIVEGSKRIGRQDFARFLNLAEASLAETEYLLVVCHDLGFFQAAARGLIRRCKKVARKLHALREQVSICGPSREGRDIPRAAPPEDSKGREATGAAAQEGSDIGAPADQLEGAGGRSETLTRAEAACRSRSERRR